IYHSLFVVQDNDNLFANCNVYFLANALEIPALKTLAAQRQQQVMMTGWTTLPLSPEIVLANFPTIAQNVYMATIEREDLLRKVLVHYAVINHCFLVTMPAFENLLS